MSPVTLPAAPILKVSSADPPARFSTPLNVSPLMSPASAPSIVQVLVVSAPATVSTPRPPVTSPVTLPAVPILKVSSADPPARFSTPLKLNPLTSPASEPLIVQVLVVSAPATVSAPRPPVTSPVTLPAVPILKVSSAEPPTRFSMPLKATALSAPASAPLTLQTFVESDPSNVSMPIPPWTLIAAAAPAALSSTLIVSPLSPAIRLTELLGLVKLTAENPPVPALSTTKTLSPDVASSVSRML